ncbi:hypothetical protein Q5752_005567 [Cryptotrichosporon argae]
MPMPPPTPPRPPPPAHPPPAISHGMLAEYPFAFAPTPNNTVIDSAGLRGSPRSFTSALSRNSQEVIRDAAHAHTRPVLSPDTSFDRISYASDAQLVPASSPCLVPESTRPVPAPLRPIITGTTSSRSGGHLQTPTDASSIKSAPHPPSPPHALAHVHVQAQSNGVRFREREVKPVDPDTVKLRQLGYDASFGRDYTFWSSLAISWLNIGCLQGTIYAVSGTYSYGGPGMILVAWPITALISLPLTLTLSELASAYPVSGAMASWAWKAARLGVGGERGWGWLMGGVVLGGHIANLVLVTWETSSVIVGTIALSVSYESHIWQQICFYLAIVAVVGSVGSTGWGSSSRYWLCAGAYGLTIWLVLCIVLLASNATKGHYGSEIVSSYYNNTGWSSRSYVYFLGWQYTSIATGFDASAHMAEETQNPSRNVPNAMTVSMIATYLLGYISIVLLLLSIDPSDAAQLAVHPFPVGHILSTAISRPGAIAICSLLVVALALQLQAQLQAASRFVFALARDHAFPFSEVIGKTTTSTRQPVVATIVCIALWTPFACLLIGSESSLYSVLAVCASTLSLVGYVTPVGLYLLSKKDLQQEGRTSWSLRKWSRPVGVLGFLYGAVVIVSQCFPGSRPVTAATISWAPVALVGTAIICYITWRLYGDRNYSGPIRALTKWETGVEIDLQTTLNSRVSKPTAGTHASFIHSEGNNVDRSLKVTPGVTISVGPAGAADDGWTDGYGDDMYGHSYPDGSMYTTDDVHGPTHTHVRSVGSGGTVTRDEADTERDFGAETGYSEYGAETYDEAADGDEESSSAGTTGSRRRRAGADGE